MGDKKKKITPEQAALLAFMISEKKSVEFIHDNMNNFSLSENDRLRSVFLEVQLIVIFQAINVVNQLQWPYTAEKQFAEAVIGNFLSFYEEALKLSKDELPVFRKYADGRLDQYLKIIEKHGQEESLISLSFVMLENIMGKPVDDPVQCYDFGNIYIDYNIAFPSSLNDYEMVF